MVVILCPECYSSKVDKCEKKIAVKGRDWFQCKVCGHKFPLRRISYREEIDIFE